ncbi:type 2 periplasmic-binding domain-containing protein [Sphingobacterium yanglingense]|nr:hypothetical protein [Sphingobacterium yanglingense]
MHEQNTLEQTRMRILLFFLLSMSPAFLFSQTKKTLEINYNKENVVASSIDGIWKAKNNNLEFISDPTVLEAISDHYFQHLKEFKIYHAGIMKVARRETEKAHPFILTELNGNPYLIFFRERDDKPYGDAESFILFIARGETKSQDRLFIGGDFNNQPFEEYTRDVR